MRTETQCARPILVVRLMVLLLLLPFMANAFALQPSGASRFLRKKSSSPKPSPMTMTLPTQSSSILFTAKDRHAYHSEAVSTNSLARGASPTTTASSLTEYRHGSSTRFRYSSSSLFATSSSSSSSSPSPENANLATRIWKALLYPIRQYIWKPIRWLVRIIAKPFRHKKTLQEDFEDKLEMLTDEQIVNGDTSYSSTPPPAAAAEATAVVMEEEEEDTQPEKEVVATTATAVKEPPAAAAPDGKKSAVAAPNVDLSGNWTMLISEDFKKQYDEYLKRLGQPLLVRSVALSIVGMTTEETVQTRQGRELSIRGRNARGVWERTLVASEASSTQITTADAETVESEAWWEDGGRVHKSWLRGGTKYGGGDFESSRYLEDNGNVLVCESVFHPKDATRERARVTWKFKRVDNGKKQ